MPTHSHTGVLLSHLPSSTPTESMAPRSNSSACSCSAGVGAAVVVAGACLVCGVTAAPTAGVQGRARLRGCAAAGCRTCTTCHRKAALLLPRVYDTQRALQGPTRTRPPCSPVTCATARPASSARHSSAAHAWRVLAAMLPSAAQSSVARQLGAPQRADGLELAQRAAWAPRAGGVRKGRFVSWGACTARGQAARVQRLWWGSDNYCSNCHPHVSCKRPHKVVLRSLGLPGSKDSCFTGLPASSCCTRQVPTSWLQQLTPRACLGLHAV